MIEEGFKKVAQEGGMYVTAIFWNPDTKEIKAQCVRDYDYADASRDNDELYYMDIDEEARRSYLRFKGVIQVGDVVEVVKGRKVPKGYIGKVVEVRKIKDRYGRVQNIYVVFEDGQKTSIDNVKIVE